MIVELAYVVRDEAPCSILPRPADARAASFPSIASPGSVENVSVIANRGRA